MKRCTQQRSIQMLWTHKAAEHLCSGTNWLGNSKMSRREISYLSMIRNHQSQDRRDTEVSQKDDEQWQANWDRNGSFRVFGFFTGSCNDIKANESVKADCSTFEHTCCPKREESTFAGFSGNIFSRQRPVVEVDLETATNDDENNDWNVRDSNWKWKFTCVIILPSLWVLDWRQFFW